jgi:hypothetical protein
MDLNCPRDFYFHVDGLAFQAKQDGMDFSIQNSNTVAAGNPIGHGRVNGFSSDDSDWDYNPGVRVGLGFYLDHDAWCIDLNWTWLHVTNYARGNTSIATGSVAPLWLLGSGTPAAQVGADSSANWEAKYNTIDLRLTKPYYVSRYLVVNPHFGLRGGWIDQHFSVDYSGTSASARTVHHGENDFWGIGTRAGIDTDWILGKGWALFGNIAASMLFGKFEIDQNLTIPSVGTGFDINHDFYQNTPNFEIVLGLGWGMHFNKHRNHVGLRAAYEFHEWFDQLNLRKFTSGSVGTPTAATPVATGAYTNDTVSRGNLTLNGFSLRVQFDI